MGNISSNAFYLLLQSSRRGGGVWTDASRGPSEDEDETASSPSGIHGRPPTADKKNLPHRRFGRLAKQRGKRAKNPKKSIKQRPQIMEGGSSFDDDLLTHPSTDLQRVHEEEGFEGVGIGTPPTDSNSSSPPHQVSDNLLGTPGNRPIRAVVANAAAISEAQHEKGTVKKRGRKRLLLNSTDLKMKNNSMSSSFGSNASGNERKKLTSSKKNSKALNKISGLDLLHKTTLDCMYGK